MGSAYGIDLHINIWFLFQLSLFFICGVLDKGLIMFLVVIIHELAHTVVARRLGIKVLEIELLPFGGVARLASDLALNTRKEILVALAGPLSNVVMIGLALGFRSYGLWSEELGRFFLQCNILLALFNLLPALPLDGGRVLRAYMARRSGLRDSTYFCSVLGQVFGVIITTLATLGLMLGFSGLDIWLLGLFVFYAATREKNSAPYFFIRQLTQKKNDLYQLGIMPAKTVVVLENVPLKEVIKPFVPDKFHLIMLLNEKMHYDRILSETEIVNALLIYGFDFPVGKVDSQV